MNSIKYIKAVLYAVILAAMVSSTACIANPATDEEALPLYLSTVQNEVEGKLMAEVSGAYDSDSDLTENDWDERLLGIWETASGVPLWFFCSPTVIEFFQDGRVYETCCDKYAQIDFHGGSRFTLIGLSGHADTGGIVEGPFTFTYSFSGDRLKLIDQDGDSATYRTVN